MDVKKKIDINFSEDDVKRLIIDYLKKEGYNATVDDVAFLVGERWEGFETMQYPVKCFKGACVRIEVE